MAASEYTRVEAFNRSLCDLLSRDIFIARSDYGSLVESYRETCLWSNHIARHGSCSMPWNDPVLNLVVPNDVSYNYAEERRLFYVALTRTRNRVFIVTLERRPSDFIKELLVFMTNDRRGGELSIQKCDWCKDGYLIVKRGNS